MPPLDSQQAQHQYQQDHDLLLSVRLPLALLPTLLYTSSPSFLLFHNLTPPQLQTSLRNCAYTFGVQSPQYASLKSILDEHVAVCALKGLRIIDGDGPEGSGSRSGEGTRQAGSKEER
ncbi:uncharacterized protein EI97DRAFT_444000 [Westerdykella ornata]|uniref:Uncharacterized protein n=1 Tax=Westerdykella ornata TaxID=318751 RepID=A0A6A6JE29_WESOR|nr:uncharacterized protein EI97DRAFT_444000 [Westerdykella ornata]KAF2274525.1 hypothetical protein EI97DRAFT_444000 [Westerdykella ornata]